MEEIIVQQAQKGWFARQHIGVQGFVVVVGTGATLFALWQGYEAYKRYEQGKGSRMSVKDTKEELKKLEKQGIKPNFSDAQFSNWANTLQQAMDGCGTGWDKVTGVLVNMKTSADVLKLIETYGTRTLDKCGFGTGDFSGDLSSTFAYKFSGFESATGGSVPQINYILQKKKINFRF